MSNLIFFSKLGNLRAVSSPEKDSENLLPGKASRPHRNLMTFQKKCNQKPMISAPKTWKIQKVQKCPRKAYRRL